MTVAAPSADPLWYKDAVIYQIHVKSFFDADNDGIGDFRGLLEKLDYIVELGVTALWLLPFYPSPRRDDGYDIADYRGVHPEYGTLNDVRRLIAAAHERGLRVIAELVVNHTSDQHPWFQRARHARPGSVARNFYVWSDNDQKYTGTRIIFVDTEKSNWTWDAVAGAYFWHRFYAHQPDLNFDNPRVLQEVLSVMRFWLDLGVDGLRLDAVPYLVEREGTINENLPETHAILKRIRAELDRVAPGRMLLAEANQWPEDAQRYFGDGDECNMCFNFPLMPRMYMAIAREDRFPITDILRQTPEIPDNCQWAIFLRNHDELTLEMVTDSERDYLWQTYAVDRRARLNLGIRRRLAPLLERDRRRIELMHGLLLSMPGTPVLYYGDEIGMGDNIHLGDRDGVRTPMQWSPDRNGGFSRADPARLVLPTIMDPLYGFAAVNVEAQSADPYSLLNWMRRMLAVRRRFAAFGRGTLRFLYPGNRKVLAFLREVRTETTEEVVLCVANLARTAQAVELDLSQFAGRVPVDMVGGSVFPPVGQLTYLLTLQPFGFFWFLLAAEAQLPPWIVRPPEPLPEFATVVIRTDIAEAFQLPGLRSLEDEILPAWLPKRRWFAAKEQALQATQLAYAVAIPDVHDAVIAEIGVDLAGGRDHYLLPLAIAWEEERPNPLPQQLALARIRRGRRVGVLTDGFAVDGVALGILAALRTGVVLDLPGGATLRFRPTAGLVELQLPANPEIRRLAVEQSNSSLILGEALVLKLLRHVGSGINPEVEMTRVLTERGYANSPHLFGEVVRIDTDGTPHTLMLVQSFVRNQGDGWSWTLDFLARAIEEIAVTGHEGEAARDAFASYAPFAAAVGRRLAELHAVLALPGDDVAFAPELVEDADLRQWGDDALEQIGLAVALLRAARDWPDAESRAMAAEVTAHAAGLRDVVRRLAGAGRGALRIRVHGDFHLGQVLVVQDDACIIDFEGEPARPAAGRRRKSCPLRDVAGLLRSFDYAAAAGAGGRGGASPLTEERRGPLLERFRIEAAQQFLAGYREVLNTAPHPWVPAEAEAALLDLFLLQKAAYEIAYEAANRPAWLPIPLRGLHAIMRRLLADEGVV